MTVTYTVGDTRKVIATIPDGSVDLIASSPPFLALRSYVPEGHASKGDEIGSERNPAEFIDMLLGLTAEWGRVLAPHGSIAIELGDTYSGNNQSGWERDSGDYRREVRSMASANGNLANTDRTLAGWPRAKSLALIPQLYAIALAYGINPLTGQPSPAGRWLVRNVIVWHRPNPAVGALGDKVRPSTSYIVVATRSPKRWFDLTAVRTEHAAHTIKYPRNAEHYSNDGYAPDSRSDGGRTGYGYAAGAPPLDTWFDSEPTDVVPFDHYDGTHDTWTLTTQPSRLAHYAMWPAKLAERLILMMCPLAVCRVCGEPRRRMETTEYIEAPRRELRSDDARSYGSIDGKRHNDHRATRQNHEGWTDCGCQMAVVQQNEMGPGSPRRQAVCSTGSVGSTPGPISTTVEEGGVGRDPVAVVGSDPASQRVPAPSTLSHFRPGLVLDPFAGSGTTLAVADLHGRDAIGVDFDARNKAIYPARYDEVKRALYGTPAPMPGQETFDFAI